MRVKRYYVEIQSLLTEQWEHSGTFDTFESAGEHADKLDAYGDRVRIMEGWE